MVKEEIPIINFSLLKSKNPDERSKTICDIGKACKEWGCFAIVNHDVPENLQMEMIEAVTGFFNLTAEEKKEYSYREIFDPIRYGTSYDLTVENNQLYLRDFLRVIVHPTFYSPEKPLCFRVTSEEYARSTREITAELLRALLESLEISEINRIEEALELKAGTQIFVNNIYPPCSQLELALGFPPHSDTSIFSIILQSNTTACLQVMHNGSWVSVDPTPGSLFVQVGDLLEIISNGICKSVLHRVILNNKSNRISVVSVTGTPLETVLSPLPQLIDDINRPAAFRAITHKEVIELHRLNPMQKSCLDLIRL